ncbi:MAG TPA: DUF4233 domain-containing protein [Aeromicrobium sp.]|nr:DUF4233 domain-containing protein [Aeromicrobium sp.]
MTRLLCTAVLSFEAVLMLLSILVLNGFSSLSVPWAAATGGGMAVACVIVAGLLGRPWGYALGHALQVAIVGLGLLALPILFVGLVFAALWVTAYVVGLRIDSDRAIR